jgi:uncharacterized protein (DUF1330 family)
MAKKGYWIGHVDVTNPRRYKDYIAANAVAFRKYGARFLVRNGDCAVPEGGLGGRRHVVIEFESYEAAKACYDSPEYQAAMKIRSEASTGDLVIIEGYDPGAKPHNVLKPERLVPPTEAEWEAALEAVAASMRPASVAQIGGFRPRDAAVSSWWGGNFVGLPDETIPVCARTGRTMQPVLQIRLDELPCRPPELADLALVNIWFDLESRGVWAARNGTQFCLRSYTSLDGLVPLGPSRRGRDSTLPVLPISWHPSADGPDSRDFDTAVPASVASWPDKSWFYDNNSPNFGTKVGGWPTWAQSSLGAEGFVLQIASEYKGNLSWGDLGQVRFFLDESGWRINWDCS